MPGHYKKKNGGRKKKHVKKTRQLGNGKMHCVCSRNHHQMGGRLLSPAAMKLLQRQHPDFRTLPVKTKQKGMGHCGCQYGGDFLGIGKAFSKVGKSIVSNPLRLALGIGTLGLSETFLTPAQLLKDSTGIRPSKVLDVAAPIIGAVGTATGNPELALGSKFTSIGLKQVGLGKRRKIRKKRK